MTTEASAIAAERKKKLLEITKSIVGTKRVGYGDDPKLRKEVIPINVLDIDTILGGGFRKGRMVMVIGQESMGKTLFTQWVIKAFQDRGEICGLMDPEKTYDPEWFEKTGVIVEDLLIVQPESTEQAFDLACTWSENGVDLIVMDSLAALTPKARGESDLEKQEFMGLSARKMSDGINLFTNRNTDSLLVCTNQLRSKIGVVYGSPDEIPGGKAQKYYSSYIIKIKRKGWIKEGDDKVGYHMSVEAIKNKLAPPFQEVVIPFMYSGVVDTVVGTVDLALDLDLIEGGRGFFKWKGEAIRGKARLVQFFRDFPEELVELQGMVKKGDAAPQDFPDGELDDAMLILED